MLCPFVVKLFITWCFTYLYFHFVLQVTPCRGSSTVKIHQSRTTRTRSRCSTWAAASGTTSVAAPSWPRRGSSRPRIASRPPREHFCFTYSVTCMSQCWLIKGLVGKSVEEVACSWFVLFAAITRLRREVDIRFNFRKNFTIYKSKHTFCD